jgi:Ca2+-binding RTX toxin-like protein
MSYLGLDYRGTIDADIATLDLIESVDTAAALGGIDTITDDIADDIILGGQGADVIDAGSGQNIVFGDHGRLLGVDTGVNTPVIDANVPTITKTDDDYQMQVLGSVASIDQGTVNGAGNEFGNGDDTITTGSGRDMIFGGGGSDTINAYGSGGALASADGNNIVFGDHGVVDYLAEEIAEPLAANPQRTNDIDRVWSLFTALGGNDSIRTGGRNDIVLGGFGNDTVDAGQGFNIAMGDSGRLTSDDRDETVRANIKFAVHDFIICKIETTSDGDFTDGGADTITGSDQNDVLFGGSGNDTIYAGGGHDLVFGDQGEVECKNDHPFDPVTSLPAICWDLFPAGDPRNGFLEFMATNTFTLAGSGDDTIFGQAGNDLLMGEQGKDTLYGGDDNDILIGGSNVTGSLDSDDRIDGGAGHDAIAGDNADICFRPDNVDVRFRVLSGTQIYYVAGMANSPTSWTANQFAGIDSFATTVFQNDPRLHTQMHIELLDHVVNDGLVAADTLATTPANRYGNDYIAGGAGEDEIFGQLGNDVIQGDGTIGVAAGSTAAQLAAAQLSLTLSAGGNYLLPTGFTTFGANRGTAATAQASFDFSANSQVDLQVTASFEGSGDADDYIEGNGGNDVIFGNLGQDDILGDSSDLYGFTARSQRPGGSDLIFGGAGTDISRNNIGDATTARTSGLPTASPNDLIVIKTDGHSLDADTIVGDNGRILRLVGVNNTVRGSATVLSTATGAAGVASTGGLLNYNYDNDAVGTTGSAYHRIVVRAVEWLDYTPGGIDTSTNALKDRAGADEIHGESGDDFIYGLAGSDVLFGEGQNDDIVGGVGNDWISGGTGDDGVIGDDGRFMTSRNSESAVVGNALYLSSLGEALNGVAKLLPDNGDTKTFNGNMLNEAIATPGSIQTATINISGALKKSINLTPFSFDPTFNGQTDEFTTLTKKTVDQVGHAGAHNSDDIIFGGLGDDSLHGASGDDAILGGEALDTAYTQVADITTGLLTGVTRSDYNRPYNPGDALRFNPLDPNGWHADRTRRAGEFALYDEYDPLRKVQVILTSNNPANDPTLAVGAAYKGQTLVTGTTAGVKSIGEFFLNFNTNEGTYVPAGTIPGANGQQASSYLAAYSDGIDRIFGDTGNDWLVGGGGRDDLYGGFGNDLMNVDDDQTTHGLLNDLPDTQPTFEDRAYGGAGRDVLIGNTGGDRLIDWVGEFNSYLVPFAPFGMATVSRTLQPQLAEFLYALSASDGADPTRAADSGKEAIRNGEPEGEMGVVRQKDVAWQSQTGAPADPQAGNIPGGHRDVLRTANFNDGSMQAFAADSGSWTVASGTLQVAASSLHSDAVAVYQVGDALPSYYEVQATVQAIKPIAGWNANSYVIFDYQGPANFKFAGLDISNNKLVMGHRNASGWIVDKQASFQGSLRSDTWYNLLLSVNGLTATLTVNGASALSFVFTPTVVDGWSYGLNWGLVGFGSNNSRGALDDTKVQVVSPTPTVTKTADFTSVSGPLFNNAATGVWAVSAGRYVASSIGEIAVNLINLGGVTQLATTSLLDLTTVVKTAGRAGFVFDRYGDTDFKFAAIDVATKQVLIGHRTSRGWVIDAAVANALLNATTDYTLGVSVRGTTVSVTLNGQAAVGFAFNGVGVDGRFGLFATKASSSSFDSLTVKTDDASVPAVQLLAAGSTLTKLGTVTAVPSALTPSRLRPLIVEAARRWGLVEDASHLAALRGIDVVIGDLAGPELAEYSQGRITIDATAAGRGWFVDATPGDDHEFSGRQVAGVDLLSVLAHEMGHAIGLGHGGGVMDEALEDGRRATPELGVGAPSEATRNTTKAPALTGAQLAAAAPRIAIDWNQRVASDLLSPAEDDTHGKDDWQARFVNRLGARDDEANPNADLEIRIGAAGDRDKEPDTL